MDSKDERDGLDPHYYYILGADGWRKIEEQEVRKFIEEEEARYGDYVFDEETEKWIEETVAEIMNETDDETEDNEDDE